LTKDALKLADLTRRGIIYCELSQDKYHEPIDFKVIDAFKDHIRNTTKKTPPVQSGRCKNGIIECICEDLLVKPNGDIHYCGCSNAPKIGNVLNNHGFEYDGCCYNKLYKVA
jgi:hypothetical protein